jgi:ATP-binding cassette, subfamily C (CFTR/MRP), member 1
LTITEQILSYADNIIVLDDGRIVDQGPYTDILARRPDTVAKSTPVQDIPAPLPVDEPLTREKMDEPQFPISNIVDVDSIHSDSTPPKGGTLSVYMYYYRSAGFVPVVLLAIFSAIEAFGSNFASKAVYPLAIPELQKI